jgi:hypothetical protein
MLEKQVIERSHIALTFNGELLPLRPIHYTRSTQLCLVGCDAFDTRSTALQAGLAARVASGPAYASLGVAERGTYFNPFAGCGLQLCRFSLLGSSVATVGRMGLGLKPQGAGRRPTVEADLSIHRRGDGTYQREFEVGAGIVF